MNAEIDAERAESFSRARCCSSKDARRSSLSRSSSRRSLRRRPGGNRNHRLRGQGQHALFAEICNACGIPYIVVYDRDAPRGEQPAEAEQIANDTILRVAGRRRSIILVPDFEGVTGLKVRRGKPAAALKRFRNGSGDLPSPLREAVERVVAAARRAPRTTRGA